MTSASLATEETGGVALFEMHSAEERLSETALRRFSTVGLASDPTTIFVHLAFAMTGMTSFLTLQSSFELRDISLSSTCKTAHAPQ
jgi:hypothetical protein